MKPKPTCLRLLSLTFYILFASAFLLTASPARKGLLRLRQPRQSQQPRQRKQLLLRKAAEIWSALRCPPRICSVGTRTART